MRPPSSPGRRPLPFFGDGPLTEEQFTAAAERYMQDYLDVTIEDIKRNGPYEIAGAAMLEREAN